MSVEILLERRKPQTLQSICFSMIAKNFSQILARPNMKKGIEFLQRKSQELLKAFGETDGEFIFLEHAVFCLNSYLWKLDLSWFQSSDIPFIVKNLEKMENTLTTFCGPEWRRDMSSDVLWQIVCVLPQSLTCLSLSFTYCTDSMMEVIAERCRNLQELVLYCCFKISDSGIKALCHTDKNGNTYQNFIIQKLDLRETKVTEVGIAWALENFTNLCEIRHDNLGKVIYDINRKASSSSRLLNAKTYNLKSIHIGQKFFFMHLGRICFPCSDVLKAFSVMCPYITKIEVKIHSQGELNACVEFASLEDVRLDIDGPCSLLRFLEARGKLLKTLTVESYSHCLVSSETLVKFCSRIEYLYLGNPQFAKAKSFASLDSRYTMPYLTKLEIIAYSHENLEESLTFILTRSTNLEKFTFINRSPFKSLLVNIFAS